MGANKPNLCCLVVARHGKTFAPDEPAVWLGCRQNPPLSDAGKAQAAKLRQALAQQAISPLFVACSPLLRAMQTADFALGPQSQVHPELDPALIELDYGRWTGQTQESIETQGDGPALRAWQRQGQWPEHVGFSPPKDQVHAQLGAAAARWHARLTEAERPLSRTVDSSRVGLVVSHSGRLRFLSAFIEPATRHLAGAGKIACANVAILVPTSAGWSCHAWDVDPLAVDWAAVAAGAK